MNFANWLTVGRILLVPVFISLLAYYTPGNEAYRIAAFWIFVVASLTDALDGFIARRWNQITRLGTIIDPLADKLLLISGLVAVCVSDSFQMQPPFWIMVVIVSRELVIIFALIIVTVLGVKISFEPNLLGKATTVSQMATLASLLLKLPISPLLWYITAALTITSGIVYVIRGGIRLNGGAQ